MRIVCVTIFSSILLNERRQLRTTGVFFWKGTPHQKADEAADELQPHNKIVLPLNVTLE